MSRTVWVLTHGINAYDQDGMYFDAVFNAVPTEAQLAAHGVPKNRISHVRAGGGRLDHEDLWWELEERTPQ